MRQQINLYQERFRIKPVVLPARQIALIELVVVGVLVLSAGAMLWSVKSAESARVRLEDQKTSLQQSNVQLRQAVEQQSVDTALETRVSETGEQLQARKQVLEWVTRSQASNRVRFSSLLAGPGRRHVQGLWLSRVKIEHAGAALQLKGNVLDPALVPEFLTALQQEPAYVGREFRKLILEEDEEAAGMRFLLTTTPPDQDAVTLNEWDQQSGRRGGR